MAAWSYAQLNVVTAASVYVYGLLNLAAKGGIVTTYGRIKGLFLGGCLTPVLLVDSRTLYAYAACIYLS